MCFVFRDTLLVVISPILGPIRYTPMVQRVSIPGSHEFIQKCFGIVVFVIEPMSPLFGFQHQRVAIVDRPHGVSGIRGDDDEPFDDFASVWICIFCPKTSKSEGGFVRQLKKMPFAFGIAFL